MKQYILFFAVFIFSCSQPSTEMTDSGKITVINEVKQMLSSYNADIRKGGLTAEFIYLDNSPGFFWVPPGYQQALSYDSVVSVIKRSAQSFKSIINSWDTLRIFPLTKELATYTGRLRSEIVDTSDNVSSYILIETGVTIKRRSGWKLLCGQTAFLPPK